MVKTLNPTAVLSSQVLEVRDLIDITLRDFWFVHKTLFLPRGGCPELFRFSELQLHPHTQILE